MGVMRVLHVAPEAYPLAKVGGLADVVGALPKALRPLGVEAHVLLPWHGGLEARRVGEVAFAKAEAKRLQAEGLALLEAAFQDLPGKEALDHLRGLLAALVERRA